MAFEDNPVNNRDPLGLWVGVDDAVTGPIDEIIVLTALYVGVKFGVPGAQEAMEAIGDAYDNAISQARGRGKRKKTKPSSDDSDIGHLDEHAQSKGSSKKGKRLDFDLLVDHR